MNLFDRWHERDQLSDEMPDYSNEAMNKKPINDRRYNFVIYLIFGICFLLAGLFVPIEGPNSQETMLILGLAFIVLSFLIKKASDNNVDLVKYVMSVSLRKRSGGKTPTKKK